jgi:hypothetical protein
MTAVDMKSQGLEVGGSDWVTIHIFIEVDAKHGGADIAAPALRG